MSNPAPNRRPFQGIILDIDGTFVDSNDLHARAWCEVLERFGFPVHFTHVRSMIGMGGDKIISEVTAMDGKGAEAEKIGHARGILFREKYLRQVKPFPKGRELVERMLAEGLQVTVGSSAKKEELEELLKIARIADLVQDKTSSDDADNSKPDPDIIQAALKKLDLPPAKVVMLGDTPYDIEAAAGASVRAIAVRSGGWDDQGLGGAISIFDDLADLLLHFRRSPLADESNE